MNLLIIMLFIYENSFTRSKLYTIYYKVLSITY